MTGVVTEADVRAAQATLDLLAEAQGTQKALESLAATQGLVVDLRGILAGQFADVRTAGYLEGVERGRREAAHVVLDALAGEGLFTTNTRAGEGL